MADNEDLKNPSVKAPSVKLQGAGSSLPVLPSVQAESVVASLVATVMQTTDAQAATVYAAEPANEPTKPFVVSKPVVNVSPNLASTIVKPSVARRSKKISASKVAPKKVMSPASSISVAKGAQSGKSTVVSPKAAASKETVDVALNRKPAFAGLFTQFMPKEAQMNINPNFAGFQDAIAEAQAKAKAAFEKSSTAFGDVTEFTKGNVEAVVESGKILTQGVQGLGTELVAESRTAFEAITSDIKELAAAKSPTDFFKLQSEMVRKSFDNAVAHSSKNSETLLKLFSDSFAPISGRMSVAMEKVRTTSI